ncbi:putative germin-like protein 9-2 [Bidens hawaiensis]|uniref:putative germin-like protein 9-2 n=1 Tax=Bidens hawaiensis TaxID=980011 RepID=UPI004049F2E5
MSTQVIFSVGVMFAFAGLVQASDPDILFDYIVPSNVTVADGNFFTYTKFQTFFDGPGGVSAPHARPHATGLFFVLGGRFEVGFVDSTNKLYTQTLETGDMFIFPKGLVHYQYNADRKEPAVAIAAFGSASASTVNLKR